MRLVRIFSKQNGDSAIELREVPMSAGERPSSPTFQGGAIFLRETAEGHVQSYHNAPRRQLIFLASGILELESSEGKRYICRPGDLIFAEEGTPVVAPFDGYVERVPNTLGGNAVKVHGAQG